MPDYTVVTELPGCPAPEEQLDRLFHRYHFAAELAEGKDVLEVACGAGVGLGYLAGSAKSVVGGDIDEVNLEIARRHYPAGGPVRIERIDAQSLPFADASFDLVILYEAVYYLPQPGDFFREAFRVLRPEGKLILCSANREWDGFNPSPFSHAYFSAAQIYRLFTDNGFSGTRLYGYCAVNPRGAKDKLTALIKRTAVALHLIPRTMKGKEIFKRFFFGKLRPIPAEIGAGMSAYTPAREIRHDCPQPGYKVIYAVGGKQ